MVKKASKAVVSKTDKAAQIPPQPKGRKMARGLARGLLRILVTLVILASLAGVGVGGYYAYRQYLAMGTEFATLKQDLAAMRLDRDLLHAEVAKLERERAAAEQKNEERWEAIDDALDRLDARINPIQRLETFIYLAERERLIGRSPRRVALLLLQARNDLRGSLRHLELLDALNQDLATYENLARDEGAPILYALMILANQTTELRFVPSLRAQTSSPSTTDASNWWQRSIDLLSDYIRIHRYGARATDRLGLALDEETLRLVKLLLESHLAEARNGLLIGDEELYRLALTHYVAKLRYYYPPGSSRARLEKHALDLARVELPTLPELKTAQILPR